MKKLLFISALATFQFVSAQKTMEIKDFTNLSISGNIEMTLIKSSENKLIIYNSDFEKLNVLPDEGILALSNSSSEKFEVVVYHNSAISDIAVAGHAKVYSKDSIKTEKLEINAASGSEVDLVVEADSINTAVASDAEVTLRGTAKNLEAAIASDAEFNADSLKTETSKTVIGSQGEASIYASVEVAATVASDGILNIYGNPKTVNELKAPGAEINRVE